ncbi:MAG: PAS domain-containing sensor histidine kinase [Deltaproteobacteria bacterium]|nr:PAS domain-containing sensor histidine kinase [Deltaproteobacteria bacterium]
MQACELQTHFAPPQRSTTEELEDQTRLVESQPLILQLLNGFPEPAMILNSNRQIIAVNDKLATLLHLDPEEFLGRRPGEVLDCIHSAEPPAGCGTTKFCRYCGAANAIVASQRCNQADIQECRIVRGTTMKSRGALDLRVWATPLEIAGQSLTLFALRDTTAEKRREVLERLFFHDVLNSAGGLRAVMEIWPELKPGQLPEMTRIAQRFANEVVEQILAQRDLTRAENGDLEAKIEVVDASQLLTDLCAFYSQRSLERGVVVTPPTVRGSAAIQSDPILLRRVIGNLIKNAVEASERGQVVRVCFENAGRPTFHVHNATTMTEAVQAQVFQRSFSTKDGQGRGVGCYSVKLLTEAYLGGRASFVSTDEAGTTFSIELPA